VTGLAETSPSGLVEGQARHSCQGNRRGLPLRVARRLAPHGHGGRWSWPCTASRCCSS